MPKQTLDELIKQAHLEGKAIVKYLEEQGKTLVQKYYPSNSDNRKEGE